MASRQDDYVNRLANSVGDGVYMESTQNGVYRAAFPAVRVFIYGREVSDDVLDIKVNQSGGSMDRSTSTVTISLANLNSRYIITHTDMIVALLSRSDSDFGEKLDRPTSYRELIDASRDSVDPNIDPIDAFIRNIIRDPRYGAVVDGAADEEVTIRGLIEYYLTHGDLDGTPVGAGTRHRKIKYDVLLEKAPATIGADKSAEIRKKLAEDNPFNTRALAGPIYIFPLAEGDCIFHPNDPIRVAFRDPFEPQKWYWMFTGFVDAYTEEVGTNQDSTVTITGTDVLKTARYSFFQLNQDAVKDPNIRDVFLASESSNNGEAVFATNVAGIKYQFASNMFAGLSMVEVLEYLFFGTSSVVTALSFEAKKLLATLSDEEVYIYLLNSGSPQVTDITKLAVADARVFLDALTTKKVQMVSNDESKKIPPLVTSLSAGSVPFKRWGADYGIQPVYIGDYSNEFERSVGTVITMAELSRLNDMLSHLVSLQDLGSMQGDFGIEFESASMSVFDVITEIGTHKDVYPVGHGRVFCIAPSGTSIGMGGRALTEQFASLSSDMHSQYKDRLTYLYDLADSMQFCAYATPRGDVVFEMPFFDFDPWSFTNKDFTFNSSIGSDTADILSDMAENVEQWVEHSERYTADDVYAMMGLSSNLGALGSGLDILNGVGVRSVNSQVRNYAKEFTFEKSDTVGFSNTLSDVGLKTICRVNKNVIRSNPNIQNPNLVNSEYAVCEGLAGTLGFRMAADVSPWHVLTSSTSAKYVAAIELRKANADSRNTGIQVLPRFSLMVNRPIYWRVRNYVANLVSCQHSISMNSSCQTTINVNNIKSWSGRFSEVDPSRELWDYFGGDVPFSFRELLEVDGMLTYRGPAKPEPDPLETVLAEIQAEQGEISDDDPDFIALQNSFGDKFKDPDAPAPEALGVGDQVYDYWILNQKPIGVLADKLRQEKTDNINKADKAWQAEQKQIKADAAAAKRKEQADAAAKRKADADEAKERERLLKDVLLTDKQIKDRKEMFSTRDKYKASGRLP